MKGLQMKWWTVLILLSFLYVKSSSQEIASDTSSSPEVKNALAFYNSSFAQQLHLFNGKEYTGYSKPFEEGQPYFITDAWSRGTIQYDGNSYENVSILYNVVTDEVVSLNYNQLSKIQLVKEKVSGFSMAGHSFINIVKDSLPSADVRPGFYDVLANGKITLLARRTKNIQSYIKQTVELKVFKKDHYYLQRDNRYFIVSNKRSFLEQLTNKKKEIQQFIKQNKLNYRKDQENTMVKILEYYNQITK